jgi:cardiolipin synthase
MGEAGELYFAYTLEVGIALLWLSAVFTIYTGFDYLRAGLKHLLSEDQ